MLAARSEKHLAFEATHLDFFHSLNHWTLHCTVEHDGENEDDGRFIGFRFNDFMIYKLSCHGTCADRHRCDHKLIQRLRSTYFFRWMRNVLSSAAILQHSARLEWPFGHFVLIKWPFKRRWKSASSVSVKNHVCSWKENRENRVMNNDRFPSSAKTKCFCSR